jgi:MFS family permease
MWFQGRHLGTAQGIGAMGIGFGLMLGPLISATVLSPWLGGWRNVMYFYGGISVVMGILWLIFGREPVPEGRPPFTAARCGREIAGPRHAQQVGLVPRHHPVFRVSASWA